MIQVDHRVGRMFVVSELSAEARRKLPSIPIPHTITIQDVWEECEVEELKEEFYGRGVNHRRVDGGWIREYTENVMVVKLTFDELLRLVYSIGGFQINDVRGGFYVLEEADLPRCANCPVATPSDLFCDVGSDATQFDVEWATHQDTDTEQSEIDEDGSGSEEFEGVECKE